MEKVLRRVRDVRMTLNEKCEMRKSRIEFVGYKISKEGIRATAENMKVIEQLPEPTSSTQMKSVLGTASFDMRCVPELSRLVEPIRRFLKAGVRFEWGQ